MDRGSGSTHAATGAAKVEATPEPVSGAVSGAPEDDVDVQFGVANGVHFSFNYCLFCSFAPVEQS